MNQEQAKGRLIVAAGALALTMDVPLVKLGDSALWSMIFLRSLATFVVAIVAWIVIRSVTRHRPALMPGKAAILYGLFFGLAMMGFLASIYHTTPANAVFIIAFNPTFCAILAWIFFKERPSLSTVVAIIVMIAGVGLIVGGGLSGGHIFGDLLAASAALALAAAITVGRTAKASLGFAPLISTIFPLLVGGFFVSQEGFFVGSPGWILLDGLVIIPLAYLCLATGPRYLSGAEVGMFYLLETVLTPIWLWMIFQEVPSNTTLLGGTLIILALAGHSLWQLRSRGVSAPEPVEPVQAAITASTSRRGENGISGP